MGKNEYKTYVGIGVTLAAVCLFVMKFDFLTAAVSVAFHAASPLLMGCVIAYILNIPLRRLERLYFPDSKKKLAMNSRRPVCIVLSFLILALICFFVIKLIVPELFSSIRLITDEIPGVAEEFRLWAITYSGELPAIQEALKHADVNWQEMAKKTFDFLAAGAGGIVNSVVQVITGIFGVTAKLLIGTIFSIYLLSAKEQLKGQADRILRAFFRPAVRKKILYVLAAFHETFTNFIVGQCMEAVIIGSLCTAGMLILRIPYAAMTGVVIGVTALIPVVGAYIGAAVGAFMVFTVNPVQAVVFIIFLVILQQLEGNLIYPKVVGSSIGLPGLWVLAAVTVGGGVLGIPGMLLGVPLAAAAYKLLKADVDKRLNGKAES